MQKRKVYIMKGLPASGKSTKARQMVQENKNLVRINKDDIREMMGCGRPWNGRFEGVVGDVQQSMTVAALNNGHDVVLDNTHLNPRSYAWVHEDMLHEEDDFGVTHTRVDVEIEIVDFTHVPVEECIERDFRRGKEDGGREVGKTVILNMAYQYGILKQEKPLVVVDIDGTVADCEHRRRSSMVNGKLDWSKFLDPFNVGKDTPIISTMEMVKPYAETHDIVFVSARDESLRDVTEEWLDIHLIPGIRKYQRLIMRPAGDHRDDTIVKKEILDKYLEKSKITVCFDDRPKVIRMWRENGLNVVDVGKGIEF